MKATFDVEWDNEDGEYHLLEDVELEAEPFWQDDSFDYAGTHCTGGIGGTHKLPKYPTLEDRSITWEKNLYSEEENKRIEAYVEKERDYISDKFCDKLRDEINDYWD